MTAPLDIAALMDTGDKLKAIHEAHLGERRNDIPRDKQQEMTAEVWAIQDAYGAPGYVPPQGWDWSGIRDSSPAAIDQMFAVVARYFA